jgi:hypothetical protein
MTHWGLLRQKKKERRKKERHKKKTNVSIYHCSGGYLEPRHSWGPNSVLE